MKHAIRSFITVALGASLALGLAFAPASAQMAPMQGSGGQTMHVDQSPECGSMVGGQWTPNGQCHEFADCGAWTNDVWTANGSCANAHMRLSGVITIVRGSMVTIQQADRTITFSDKPALRNQTTGHVAVGRTVTVHGYWKDGMFYATSMDTIQ